MMMMMQWMLMQAIPNDDNKFDEDDDLESVDGNNGDKSTSSDRFYK